MRKADYKEDELKELTESDFLAHGEMDLEVDHLIHYDHRIMCYICKKQAYIHEAEKFAKNHRHSDDAGLDLEVYALILDAQIGSMKALNNPNLGE